MALARYPDLRILGQEPDEVEVEVTVTGKRTREVVIALAKFVGNGEIIPVSIGLPGLDAITGGILVGTQADMTPGGEALEIKFTVMATQERETDG